MIMRQFLGNRRANTRAKVAAAAAAVAAEEGSPTPEDDDGEHENGSQGDDQSDVIISDIGDD